MIANVKSATELDREIGTVIRTHRVNAGLSQKQLADIAGVTFQQIQKYEKGTNRVSSSRLHKIAACLGVPVTTFFGSAGDTSAVGLTDRDGRRLTDAWTKLTPALRARVADLAEAIAAGEGTKVTQQADLRLVKNGQ